MMMMSSCYCVLITLMIAHYSAYAQPSFSCSTRCDAKSLLKSDAANPALYHTYVDSSNCQIVVYVCAFGSKMFIYYSDAQSYFVQNFNGTGYSMYCDSFGVLRSVDVCQHQLCTTEIQHIDCKSSDESSSVIVPPEPVLPSSEAPSLPAEVVVAPVVAPPSLPTEEAPLVDHSATKPDEPVAIDLPASTAPSHFLRPLADLLAGSPKDEQPAAPKEEIVAEKAVPVPDENESIVKEPTLGDAKTMENKAEPVPEILEQSPPVIKEEKLPLAIEEEVKKEEKLPVAIEEEVKKEEPRLNAMAEHLTAEIVAKPIMIVEEPVHAIGEKLSSIIEEPLLAAEEKPAAEIDTKLTSAVEEQLPADISVKPAPDAIDEAKPVAAVEIEKPAADEIQQPAPPVEESQPIAIEDPIPSLIIEPVVPHDIVVEQEAVEPGVVESKFVQEIKLETKDAIPLLKVGESIIEPIAQNDELLKLEKNSEKKEPIVEVAKSDELLSSLASSSSSPPVASSNNTSSQPHIACSLSCSPKCLLNALKGNRPEFIEFVNESNCQIVTYVCNMDDRIAIYMNEAGESTHSEIYDTYDVSVYCDESGSTLRTISEFKSIPAHTPINMIDCIQPVLKEEPIAQIPCTSCNTSVLNPRGDTLTNYLTTTVNNCVRVEIQCVGQSTTPNMRFYIVYANGFVDKKPYIQESYSLVCNGDGAWIDPAYDNRVVERFFCFETITTSDCTTCGALHTLSMILSDVDVPLYNRTSVSPNICCSMSPFVTTFQSQENTTALLSTIFADPNPSYPGVIGTANCSASEILCVCGYMSFDADSINCYVGNSDAHVYLLEYCNRTAKSCSVIAVPFAGSMTLNGGFDKSLPVPQFNNPYLANPDSAWPMLYPNVAKVSCVSRAALCVSPVSPLGRRR